ncbi:175_t:CDS:2 [Funneliformis mosseae]|uniref:175_t:CDS:1 n=1 Tax=Funneliformis mosseae TaxID=27381 RepID=A0A9N8YS60_FUNMO|nr:175_t:CDS:2 [Funneliformis mosseae]
MSSKGESVEGCNHHSLIDLRGIFFARMFFDLFGKPETYNLIFLVQTIFVIFPPSLKQ